MEWLSLILGAGGVAFIGAVFKGIQMLRESTAARTAKAVSDLERWREEADERTRLAREEAAWYLDLASYWQQWSGAVEYAASQGGVTLPKRPKLPVRKTQELPSESLG